MKKYYIVKAFLIKKEDLSKGMSYDSMASVPQTSVFTFVAEKTPSGFKEVKTQKNITDVYMRNFSKERYDGSWFLIDDRTKKEIERKGAMLVTTSKYWDTSLVKPVTDINQVVEYLKNNNAVDVFEQLEKFQVQGKKEYKEAKQTEISKKRRELKSRLVLFKKKLEEKSVTKKANKNLNEEIEEMIKKQK